MLTFEITKHERFSKKNKPKFVNGSFDHRAYILSRHVRSVRNDKRYRNGEEWYVPDIREKGIIIGMLDQVHEVEWDGLKAKFIEVYFSGKETSYLYHPSDLRKKQ